MSENLTTFPSSNGIASMISLIKSRLGYPTVQLNEITNDQIRDFINYSFTYYVGQIEPYKAWWQTQMQAGTSMYRMPEDFVGMAGQPLYVPNAIIEYIKTFTGYQMYVNFTGNLDITHYEAIMEHLQLKLNRLGAVPTFDIVYKEDGTAWLKVFPAPWDSDRVIVFSYVRMPKLEEWNSGRDLIGYTWVFKYSLALCKEAIGRVRSRYGDAVGVGDVTINQDGSVLLAEAKAEMEKLEVELQTYKFTTMAVF
jgi:hypothetical protein